MIQLKEAYSFQKKEFLIYNGMTETKYPGVAERIKAMMIDNITIVFFMFLFAYIFSLFKDVPDSARIAAILFIFLLYDPLFTSVFGGTIGHFFFGIRVKKESDETKNISIFKAIPRYIVKVFIGTISLLTTSKNEKRKALHDLLVGSVVVYAKK